jgi:hypothetical protein
MLQEDTRDDLLKIRILYSLVSGISRPSSNRNRHSIVSISMISTQDELPAYSQRNYTCSPAVMSSINRKHICKSYLDSDEQYHIIYENFINLYKKHVPYGSRLNNEKPEIFISYIKQFFFDKGILSDSLYKLIIQGLKKDQWVDARGFANCVESIQTNFFNGIYYFFKSPPEDIKSKLEAQKLLCIEYIVFFKFINVKNKKTLNFFQIVEVFKFSFPGFKESEVNRNAREVFQKVTYLNGISSQYISFQDFLKVT